MNVRSTKIFLLFAFLIGFSACEKRSCKNVVCPASEQCLSGQCVCDDGLEGTGCATQSSQKYVGNYQAIETCYNSTAGSPFSTYYPYIGSDPSYLNRIIIYSLFGQCTAYAYIYTDASNQGNTIKIPQQSPCGITFSGSGYYDGTSTPPRLIINFDYIYNGIEYQCQHIFYKQ